MPMNLKQITFNKCSLNRAYTLIELIISIVIISVAFVGMLLAFDVAGRHSGNPIVYFQSISIAKSYLEEVLVKEFPTTLPCPAAPALRKNYTNVCDYKNLSNTGVFDASGNAVNGLENYNVTVNVDTSGAVLGGLASGTDVVRIDVTVSLPGVTQGYTLSGYRTRY